MPRNDAYSEVSAIDVGHPITAGYARTWELQIKPETHFVLALWPPSNSLMPGSHLPSLALEPSSRIPSPAPSLGTSSGHSQHSFPPSQMTSEYSHPSIPDVPPTNFGDFLLLGTPFLEACRILGLSPADIARAKFVGTGPAGRRLVAMVQNWAAAAHVLAKFCISLESPTHRFSGGLEVELQAILTEIGWTNHSFSKKNLLYLWAAHSATLFWPTAEPPVESGSDFDLYMTWRAICFIWRAGGPAQTGIDPSKNSDDPVEKAAAGLTRTKIKSERVKLTRLLVEIAPSAMST
ncbi:hypothetical protein C8R45DRAFT_1115202 [Mycena sanguinolenta]|nr:hypothetical protein C8R45DRAFT_1115202 [Mycena sanguinolenta]